MTPAHIPSLYASIGIVLLVALRMVQRFRRLVGRQPYHRYRPWITVVFFPLLIVLLAVLALRDPPTLLALLAGLPAGYALGRYGLRSTRFEATAEGLFYTPNAHLGIALSLLMMARLGYRYFTLYAAGGLPSSLPQQYTPSALTLGLFGVLAGYYVTYAAGLLRWHRDQRATPPPPQLVTD